MRLGSGLCLDSIWSVGLLNTGAPKGPRVPVLVPEPASIRSPRGGFATTPSAMADGRGAWAGLPAATIPRPISGRVVESPCRRPGHRFPEKPRGTGTGSEPFTGRFSASVPSCFDVFHHALRRAVPGFYPNGKPGISTFLLVFRGGVPRSSAEVELEGGMA